MQGHLALIPHKMQGEVVYQRPAYWHSYEDGRRIKAKAYPEHLLGDFRRHFREEWLRLRAAEYFRGRDSEALAYLPRLIAGPERAA